MSTPFDSSDSPESPALHPTNLLSDGMTWDILTRYVTGAGTSADVLCVDRWRSASERNNVLTRHLIATWEREWILDRHIDLERISRTVAEAIRGGAFGKEVPLARTPRDQKRSFTRVRWQLAALFAGILVVVIGVITAPWKANETPANSTTLIATRRGQHTTATLPDGSTVTLAPATQLSVTMTPDSRMIDLQGEAVFQVMHRDAQPFTVRARNTTTVVLGTTFGVRNYPEDPAVRIAVRDGKVATNSVVLAGGSTAHIPTDGVLQRSATTVDDVLGWQTGRLVFKDVPLRNIVADLSRAYNIDFVLGTESLGDLLMSVTFTNDSLPEVVDVISVVLDLNVKRQGRTYVIDRKYSVQPSSSPNHSR